MSEQTPVTPVASPLWKRATSALLRGSRATDVFVVVLVACAALVFSFSYFVNDVADNWLVGRSPTPPNVFVASAMVAFGHGLTLPQGSTPGLERFSQQQQDTLTEADLPDPLILQEVMPWELRHRYLLTLVGWVWKITGVSWEAMKGLLAIVLALTLVLVYGVMRQGMGPLLSVAATWCFLYTPSLLFETTSVRDFFKVPFFCAVLLLLGWMVRRPPPRWGSVGIAALLGAVIGVGLGFRHDLLICLFPAFVVLLACSLGPWRSAWHWKAGACAACLLCFLVASWPVFTVYRGAGAPAHDAIMGLAARTDDDLGLTRTSYQRMAGSNDFLIYAQELGYAHLAQGLVEPFTYDDARAEATGRSMLLHMLIRYPADFIAKAYAAVLWTLSGATPNYRYQIYQDWGRPLFRPAMLAAAAIAFMLLCARELRLGWLALFLFLYFTMYTTIQFQYRHVFHLAIFAPWIIGFLSQQVLLRLGQYHAGAFGSQALADVGGPRRAGARAVGSALAVSLLFLLPLHAARAYQAATASDWLQPYEACTREPVPTLRCEMTDWVLFRLADDRVYQADHDPPWVFEQDYLLAELAGSDRERPMWLVYDALPGVFMGDFSAPLTVPITGTGPDGDVQCFFPVFSGRPTGRPAPDLFFAGVAMKAEDADAFHGLYRVTNPETFSLTPVVWLPRDRSRFRPYAHIGLPYPFDTLLTPPVHARDCERGAPAP